MFTFLLVVFVIVAILLILVVLLQMGRGAELGAAFGSVGQAQMPQTPENFIGKLTTYLAIVFMLLAFGLAFLSAKERGSSVLDRSLQQQSEAAPTQNPDSSAAVDASAK